MWSDGNSRHNRSYYAVCGFICFFFSFEGVVLFVLAIPHSLQNLSSLTKDQMDAPCHGSLESEALDCREIREILLMVF